MSLAVCSLPPTATSRRGLARRSQPVRLRPLLASSSSSAATSTPSFEQLYVQLAGALAAPGSAVQAAPTPLGRGLVATRDVPQGDTLLSVDWANLLCVTDHPQQTGNALGRRVLEDSQLLHAKLPPLLVRYLLADGDWFPRLMAWLLWLKHNAQGPWRRYIDLLPKEEEMACLMNFRNEAERAELQSAALEARARTEREQISGLHDRLFSSSTGELRALQLAPTLDDTVWAACMVNSRCFSDTIDGEAVSLLVPCADMANHVLNPNASYQFVPEADAFQLRALSGIPAGAEACISYGCTRKDSMALMRDYGFVIPGNINDRIPFNTGDDIASQLAAGGSSTQRPSLSAPRLLAALGLPAASGESGGGLDLTAAAEAAMLDTEQAAHQRRRLATIMSLQPFLRDLTLSAAAAEPLVGAELGCERQSVAALQAQCQALLGRMPTTAVEDEATLSAAEVQQLGPRLQQAVATRLENKRLLLAAAGALQQYAVALC